MQKVNTRGKLFFRYLFSYLAIVLIPLVIIGAFYSTSFFKAFSSEVFSNVDKDLALIASQIDSKLLTFNNTAKQVAFSTQLQEMPDYFEPENINAIKQMLSNYNDTNAFTQEIYFVLPNIGYVVSSTSSSRLDYFTEGLFSMDGVSPKQLRDFFAAQTPGIIPSSLIRQTSYNDPSKALLFSYPIYTDYLKMVGTLVFQVPSASIAELVNGQLSQYNAETVILDTNMRIIDSVGATEKTLRLLADGADGIKQAVAQLDDSYVVISHQSDFSRFSYITLIPRNQQTFKQIERLNYLFLIAVLLAAFISSLAIAYALRLNYFPLRKLHDKAGSLVQQKQSMNELFDIENALEQLSGKNIYLEAKLEDNAASIKINRLQKLITNGYPSLEDFNLDCLELDMHLSSDSIFVTTSYIHSDDVDLDTLGLLFRKELSGRLESYYIFGMETNKLIMIHSLPISITSLSQRQIVDIFTQLHKELLDSQGVTMTTGIGSIVKGTTEISHSYLDSYTALDYRFLRGNGQVISFSEIGSDNGDAAYPQQCFDKLRNALLTNNEGNVSQCIDEIIEIVEKNNYPLSVARGICFNLINIATNTFSGEVTERSFVKPNLFALAEIDTIQDLVKVLKAWRSELHTMSAQSKNDGGALTIHKVMEYLEKHCLNCNFSICETAEYFGMSLPKFSQYFKEQVNQNVLDYTIRIRMEAASRLLTETQQDVKDIALQTGYYNTSSFIRRFKQMYGVTPGDYRKFIRKENKGD